MKLNDVSDKKTYWQTIKPYFNEKGSGSNKIALSGNESVLTDAKEIANTMSNYFININQVSIKKISEVFPEICSNNFELTKVTEQSVKNEVLKLHTKKSSTSVSIPATILKQSIETRLAFLTKSNKFSYH